MNSQSPQLGPLALRKSKSAQSRSSLRAEDETMKLKSSRTSGRNSFTQNTDYGNAQNGQAFANGQSHGNYGTSAPVPAIHTKQTFVNVPTNLRPDNKNIVHIMSDSSVSDDELSTGTQGSEYMHHVSTTPPASPSGYSLTATPHSHGNANTSNRVSCYVYKRKSGFMGKWKKSYVVASEKGKYVSKSMNQTLETFKTGIYKIGGGGHHHSDQDEGNPKQDAAGTNVKMWERRRLVLEGRLLMYYHEDAALEEEELKDMATTPIATNQQQQHAQPHSLKRLKQKLNEFAEHANPLKQMSQADINAPRGVIDIIGSQSTASIVPISPHSFAPTPYCLTIMVKNETKWVLCFDTEREALKWLHIFTNVSLRQSRTRFQKFHGKEYDSSLLLKDDDGSRVSTSSRKMERSLPVEALPPSVGSIMERDLLGEIQPVPEESYLDESVVSNNDDYMLPDANTCKVFALVNCAFLFMALEKAAVVTHPLAFVVINLLTWVHLKGVSTQAMEDAPHLKPETIEIENIDSSRKSVAFMNGESHELSLSPIRRQVSVSSSFVEMKKSVDDDEESIYRPWSGSTTVQLKHAYEKSDAHTIKWVAGKPSIMDLRGPDYLTSKRKMPSMTSLYELVELDCFDSDEHMTDVGTKFRFPAYDYGQAGHWCAPDTLIISFALPTSPPKLRSGSNGKGYIVCGYFRIRSEVRKTLEIISNSDYSEEKREEMLHALFPEKKQRMLINGVKLWEKWCGSAKTDPEMQKRLKFIPRGDNLRELGVPSWICRYNGKPMLIKRPGETSFIFSHPYDRTLEIDVNLHPLPFMFKQAMTFLKDNYFPKMIMTFGFVIEGREDNELPEVLLGNPIQIPFCVPNYVSKADDIFSCDQASF